MSKSSNKESEGFAWACDCTSGRARRHHMKEIMQCPTCFKLAPVLSAQAPAKQELSAPHTKLPVYEKQVESNPTSYLRRQSRGREHALSPEGRGSPRLSTAELTRSEEQQSNDAIRVHLLFDIPEDESTLGWACNCPVDFFKRKIHDKNVSKCQTCGRTPPRPAETVVNFDDFNAQMTTRNDKWMLQTTESDPWETLCLGCNICVKAPYLFLVTTGRQKLVAVCISCLLNPIELSQKQRFQLWLDRSSNACDMRPPTRYSSKELELMYTANPDSLKTPIPIMQFGKSYRLGKAELTKLFNPLSSNLGKKSDPVKQSLFWPCYCEVNKEWVLHSYSVANCAKCHASTPSNPSLITGFPDFDVQMTNQIDTDRQVASKGAPCKG